ncbi:oxidative damage protection protein [Nevskia sp.]|uniref:oxidative damage protection protein n=1 Tax=Nevskia sp. TaxID=1929292 RepID=UPI003F6EE636
MSRTVHCIKLGQEAEGLPRPPVPGDLGQRIFEQVSKKAWADWLAHQTRLINEMRLSLADAESRKFLMTELEKYFYGGGDLTPTGYVPPVPAGPRRA